MGNKVPNILIIDDDPMSSFMLKRLAELGELANIITILNSGKSALEYIRERKNDPDLLPDIIFLDIYMPIITGWDFLDEYQTFKHELSKSIRIIIISSSNHPRDIGQVDLYKDVSDYVVKPISLDRLKEIVGQIRSK